MAGGVRVPFPAMVDRRGARCPRARPRRAAAIYELFACDPALADTAAFCAAYGFAMENSANTIVVVGKSDPPVYAACVVLATHRLNVNRAVRNRLGTRKASFASPDETRAMTGHEIGGVTVFGLPDGLPILVDAAVMERRSDRPRRGEPELEGDRAAVDPAHDRARGGRGGPGDSGAARARAFRRRGDDRGNCGLIGRPAGIPPAPARLRPRSARPAGRGEGRGR